VKPLLTHWTGLLLGGGGGERGSAIRKVSTCTGHHNTEHASSGIQIHDPNVRVIEDRVLLTQGSHYDRYLAILRRTIVKTFPSVLCVASSVTYVQVKYLLIVVTYNE
jgi:hypothetical protein